MKKIFLITLILMSKNVFASVTVTQVENVLAKYCVPKFGDIADDGYLTCNGIFEGVYKTNSTCSCASKGDTADFKHLIYNNQFRRCRPRCQPGYYIEEGKEGKCPAGRYQVEITK